MSKKGSDKIEKLRCIRHSAEHVLTQAMMNLWPNKIVMAMGPATDNGFYFDFDVSGKLKISEDDFIKIEKEMNKIKKQNLPFRKEELSVEKARKLFPDNPYKQEWLDEIEERKEKATVYWTGNEFVDLCSGPHVEHTGQIGEFKLLSIAGAYWRGNEKNPMLSRIYGTTFTDKKELNQFLKQQEEAKKRDHKVLGKRLGLFLFSPLVGSGLPLWTPKGTLLRLLLDEFIWSIRKRHGYQKVTIPHITKKDLYVKSGHWEKFHQELFKIKTREKDIFAIKPMNCPHHAQIYAHKQRSYKELPVRFCETTMVYRDEQSGELGGLTRVRSITQDDAHVFLRKNQVEAEFLKTWDIVDEFYKAFGFDLQVRLSLHDPTSMEKYLGSEQIWNDAEKQLRNVVIKRKAHAYEAIGEAALYGPKIDFMAQDVLGREWQVATIQLDLNMPKRFGLFCINEKGEKEDIVMMHCAVMGAIERFVAILIEHYAGAFPLWLSPIQIAVLPISDKQTDYANKIHHKLIEAGIRSKLDISGETLSKKIRNWELNKIPYIIVIGKREEEKGKVAIRKRGEGDKGTMDIDKFLNQIKVGIMSHLHPERTK